MSRAVARPAGQVASAHRARVANTHRRRGSALEAVPCVAAAVLKPVHVRPPYVETSQKASPCPAASCGECPGTTHGTSCRFRSVSEGCMLRRGGAARLSSARNSRHRGRTRQPAAAKTRRTHRTIPSRPTTQKTRLERGQKPPLPQKHAKRAKRCTHLKQSTPTTQQARVGDTNGGFCALR